MRAFLKKAFLNSEVRSQASIQVLSDLHLEIGPQYDSYTFPASAPFLLLGGDIGRLVDYDGYLRFIEVQVSRYEKVFLVLGNHEFYGLDYRSGIEQAERLTGESSLANKLVLLNKTRWDDPNSLLTIIGCTLWSAIPDQVSLLVQMRINDFERIKEWTVGTHNRAHAEEVAWLRKQVDLAGNHERDHKRHILIATHHAPSLRGTSRPEHSANPWSCAFATDLVNRRDWKGVQVWVFGHTHYSTDFVKQGIRIVANQRGYVLSDGTALESRSSKTTTPRGASEFNPAMVVAL